MSKCMFECELCGLHERGYRLELLLQGGCMSCMSRAANRAAVSKVCWFLAGLEEGSLWGFHMPGMSKGTRDGAAVMVTGWNAQG